jgi:hypothetical protein
MGAQFVDRELLRILLATLLDVFPHVRVYCSDLASVVFLASDQPLDLEASAAAAIAADPAALAAAGIRTPEDVAVGLMLDEEGARRFAAGAEISTDDRNHLRTRSPELVRSFSQPRAGGRRGGLDLQKTFQASGFMPEPAPELDRLRLVRGYVRRSFLALAPPVAREIRDPVARSVAEARIASARGEPAAVLAKARTAIERDPSSRDALAELVDLWRYGVQPGRDLARKARPAGDARAVIRGMERLDAKDFAGLEALEGELAGIAAPTDPLAAPALRLRAAWRIGSGDPARAREAMALFDTLASGVLDRFDYLERARAAQLAGDSFGTLSSLQQIFAGGISRRRLPPRLIQDARAVLRAVPPESEWQRWAEQLRDQLDKPVPGGGRNLAVSR